MVGRPTAAVVLASPAPPVAASPTSNPRSRATAWDSPTSAATASVRSIGGCRWAGSSSAPAPWTVAAATIRSTSSMAWSKAAIVAALTSTCRLARSATTLVRLPPRSTPTLQVTPGQRPFRAARATVLWAASSTALTPSVGRTPAWTALPVTSMVNAQMPLRAETRAPLVRAASSPTATSCSAARASSSGRLNGDPISSSGEQTRVIPA